MAGPGGGHLKNQPVLGQGSWKNQGRLPRVVTENKKWSGVCQPSLKGQNAIAISRTD